MRSSRSSTITNCIGSTCRIIMTKASLSPSQWTNKLSLAQIKTWRTLLIYDDNEGIKINPRLINFENGYKKTSCRISQNQYIKNIRLEIRSLFWQMDGLLRTDLNFYLIILQGMEYRIFIFYQKVSLRTMKSIIEVEGSDGSLGLLPYKNKNSRFVPVSEHTKDLNMLLSDPEPKILPESKILSVVNMSVYNLKNTYKDKRKIKDAVTVKRMKLLCKQNVDTKKIPVLLSYAKRSSLNISPGREGRKNSVDKSPLQIVSKKAFCLSDFVPGMRTSTSPTSPELPNERKLLKSQKIDKQLEKGQTIFETKTLLAQSKSDALINIKLRSYIKSIKEGRKLHHLSEQINREVKKKSLKIRIKKGNNSSLIKWLFKKRWWWTIEDEKQDKEKARPNFIWSQLKQKSFFENCPNESKEGHPEGNPQVCHNHFIKNQYLGNKKALFYNMSHYYSSKGMNVFEKLPLTFHVVSLEDKSWRQFTQKFQQFKKEGQSNIWILKPGENSNRGRGITVHESYSEIKSIIGSGQTFFDNHDAKLKKRTYIIQAYIDKPFLYNKRKFDIRCYMLLVNINKTVKGYWYSEGYIRTSSFEFQLNDFNTFVHLTNDAVQNHSENYGKYEEGNKVSYAQFQKYLDTKYPGAGYDLQKQIIPVMKQIATDSMKATTHIVKGQNQEKPVFEIFGLDFMIDKNFKPWLIEINTNPCIQTSCLVLEKVIPRMLDDALKLTLDLLFPPPQYWPSSRKHCLPSQENKFELVYEEEKDESSSFKKEEFPSLGVITQDGEFYEQKQND